MAKRFTAVLVAAFLAAAPVVAQRGAPPAPLLPGQSNDPFPAPIPAAEGVIKVNAREFASLPDIERRGGADDAPRRRARHAPPVRQRHARSPLQRELRRQDRDACISTSTPRNGASASSRWAASAAFRASPFTRSSVSRAPRLRQVLHLHRHHEQDAAARLHTANPTSTHDTVLLEWTAKTPGAATYDGGPPRELIRLRQPFQNHNAGHLAFNPTAAPGSADFGLLYIGVADGGSGGDPMQLAQNLGSAFGKILRIDPLGTSAGQEIRHPAGNPFVKTPGALPEIYAYGVRNPQRFGWDSRNGAPVRRGHRSEHHRGNQPRHGRRQSRLERLGGQLPFRQPPGRQPGEPARRSESDLPDRRVGTDRSATAGELRGDRRRRLPRQRRFHSSPTCSSSPTCRAARSST